MTDKIPQILADIEQEHHIKIIFAVESGSRVWGLDSPDSDYDIRGVYIELDVLERNNFLTSSKTKSIDGFTEDRLYDWVFWDIRSFLKFVNGNNSTSIDWIMSNLCYVGNNQLEIIRERFSKYFDTNMYLLHHYGLLKSMYEKFVNPLRKSKEVLDNKSILNRIECISKNLDILKASRKDKLGNIISKCFDDLTQIRELSNHEYHEENVPLKTKIKKVLYVCRSALSIEYLLQKNKIPPLDINILLQEVDLKFDKKYIEELITLKRKTKELEELDCPEWVTNWYQELDSVMVGKFSQLCQNKKSVSNDIYVNYYLDCIANYV